MVHKLVTWSSNMVNAAPLSFIGVRVNTNGFPCAFAAQTDFTDNESWQWNDLQNQNEVNVEYCFGYEDEGSIDLFGVDTDGNNYGREDRAYMTKVSIRHEAHQPNIVFQYWFSTGKMIQHETKHRHLDDDDDNCCGWYFQYQAPTNHQISGLQLQQVKRSEMAGTTSCTWEWVVETSSTKDANDTIFSPTRLPNIDAVVSELNDNDDGMYDRKQGIVTIVDDDAPTEYENFMDAFLGYNCNQHHLQKQYKFSYVVDPASSQSLSFYTVACAIAIAATSVGIAGWVLKMCRS